MAGNSVSLYISLLLITYFICSVGLVEASYSLETTVPPNGSSIEVFSNSILRISCQFITNSETDRQSTSRIRWFFKGDMISSSLRLYYRGISRFEILYQRRRNRVVSNLTLFINNSDSLHNGAIACYPPGNDTSGETFGLFRTVLASRTVTIRWNSSLVTVDEDQGHVLICASAQGWTIDEATLTVSILTLNNTATVGEDFREFSENLTFTEPSVCIEIEIIEDDVHELDEYISLEMVPPSLPSTITGEVNIVTSTAAKVVIVEDDEMLVEMYVSGDELVENSGNGRICVELSSDANCPVGFLFIAILSITNTQLQETSLTQELKFPPCARIRCIDLLIENDDIAENEERILISMEIENSPDNGLIPMTDEQVITIIDDDVLPEMYTYSVAENNRSVEVCFRGRTAPINESVTLTISTFNNGSATAGEDYVSLSSAPLTLLRDSARGCIEVSIIPDDLLEETENFTITLDSLSAVSITIFIEDTTVCMTGDLRLVDGETNNTGRLEICYDGEWGTVCDDLFDEQAALVACRQLGFDDKSIPIYSGFPDGNLPTLMDDVQCTGSENKLIECSHTTREGSNCVATEAVGIICGDICNDGQVKFSDIDVSGNFYVDICHDGEYYHVCGDGWDSLDAIVACREAGFNQYSIAFPDSGYIISSERRITNTTCFGSEPNFSSCGFETTTSESCSWAAVKCNASSPCPSGTFWCPESGSGNNTLCIPREAVCNGSNECLVSSADELVCTVVNFTQESYTVGEESSMLNVCVEVIFPKSLLLPAKPTFLLVLQTIHDNIGNVNHGPIRETLNFNPDNSTQCTSIKILDDKTVALSRTGFVLFIDSYEDQGLYIDRRYSRPLTYVEILDNEACDVNNQFLCESRLECLSLSVLCNGVVDCNDTQTDEDNCIGFCESEMVDGLSWPRTQAGHSAELVCPDNRNRSAKRDCRHGVWVDIRICLTFSDTPEVTEENIGSVLSYLKLVVSGALKHEETEESAAIVTQTLTATANLLKSSNNMSPEEMIAVLTDIIRILDGLLKWDTDTLRTQGPKNVENFEAILVNLITLPTFTEELFITSDDIAVFARPITTEMYADVQMPFTISSIDSKPNITESSRQTSDSQIVAVTFPRSIFGSEQIIGGSTGPLAVSVIGYEIPALFPPPTNRGGAETSVSTPVVSMIVAGGGQQLEFSGLDPPAEVSLKVTQVENKNFTNVRCVFWDFELNAWSTNGCKTHYAAGEDYINCTCTHLTNFAALVDVCRRVEGCETSERADYILSILSIIGACLSIMGLVVTIITMLFFRRLRKRDASKFHVQLCLAMLAMLLVFVTGVQQTRVKAGCVTVSVLIHYFTLVAVMWMGAEAILMFQKLVIVFGRVTMRHIVIVSFICWLAPIIPVLIPVAINPNYVIFEAEDDNIGFCFISNTVAFFAAFLAPIMITILFNYVVFIIIVIVLVRHKFRNKMTGLKASRTKERQSTLRLMISIAGIMSLYGLTWVFGALTINKASLAFQVLFVLFNSLQGFFIFLFFCVLGRDGRELWLEILFCGRYKSSHLHPTSVATGSSTRKANNLLTTSENPSSTAAVPPPLEKSFSSMSTGGAFVINYVEFNGKSKEEGDQSLSDAEERPTPEPNITAIKEEELSDTQTYTVHNKSTTENGHTEKDNSEEPVRERSQSVSVAATEQHRDDEDADSLEELKDVIQYVETTFVNALS